MSQDLIPMHREFRNPGKDYRSAPFWSWNGRMKPGEVRRQVRDMKAHGMGGFFMHSRVGLETRYMGPEWMRAIEAAADEAAKIGMNAWLYDEDRWPSGAAGGLASSRGEACQKKRLVMRTVTKTFKPTGKELAAFAVKTKDERLLSARRLKGAAKPKRGETVVTFTMEVCEPTPWHNGWPYGDNMSAESVRALIETTYIPYGDALKQHIPKVVPGIFTDEPNIAQPARERGNRLAPWTAAFVEEFKARRGYDILDALPSFFFDSPRSIKVRHDYWKTVTELFAQNFSRQLGTWSRKHGLALTGHYNQEGSLLGQMNSAGATMPNYVWQDAPGIDILTEQRHEYITAKQCSSVASQFGRKWVLSELYGCTGWEFTFEGMKWVGDWQFALGVTLRCPHLALYTLKGCAKRDYPPSFNYNNTWWKHNRAHEDYFARVSLALTEGKPVRDILLVHPIASAWCEYDNERPDGPTTWNRRLEATMRTLLAQHRDFDFGDEMILADYADVKGRELRVKKMRYKVVVLPPMLTMSATTADLLEKFLKSGGKVIALEPTATRVDALATERLAKIWKHRGTTVIADSAALADALDDLLAPTVRIRTTHGQELEPVLHQLRRDGRRRILFMCNTDRDVAHDAEIVLAEKGAVEEWDLLTGETRPVEAFAAEKGTMWRTAFGPAGSRLFVIDTAKKPSAAATDDERFDAMSYPAWEFWFDAILRPGRKTGEALLGPIWDFARTDPNVLTLDRCRYRLKGSKRSEVMPVWQAQKAVREKLGLRPVWDNSGVQRWCWIDTPQKIAKAPTEYCFAFTVDDVPKGKVSLVLEGSEHFRITLNGKKVATKVTGWYLDRSMHTVTLPKLKTGENKLVLSCNTVDEMQVEDCFLIGDFGVDACTRAITREPDVLHSGDWSLQGYAHYAGGMIYRATVDVGKKKLRAAPLFLGKFSATVVAVRVNGKDAGYIPWRAADGLDLAKHLKPGKNRIEIEVMGSPRNMMGPLHESHGKTPWVGAGQFRTTGDDYTDEYVLWPWGLMGQARVDLYR